MSDEASLSEQLKLIKEKVEADTKEKHKEEMREMLTAKTVKELRKELGKRGLTQKGLKADLVSRILDHDLPDDSEIDAQSNPTPSTSVTSNVPPVPKNGEQVNRDSKRNSDDVIIEDILSSSSSSSNEEPSSPEEEQEEKKPEKN